MRSMIDQLRGAFKLYGLLIVALTVFNVWIIKDQRHFGVVVADENCDTMLVDDAAKESVKAFFQVEGRQ